MQLHCIATNLLYQWCFRYHTQRHLYFHLQHHLNGYLQCNQHCHLQCYMPLSQGHKQLFCWSPRATHINMQEDGCNKVCSMLLCMMLCLLSCMLCGYSVAQVSFPCCLVYYCAYIQIMLSYCQHALVVQARQQCSSDVYYCTYIQIRLSYYQHALVV